MPTTVENLSGLVWLLPGLAWAVLIVMLRRHGGKLRRGLCQIINSIFKSSAISKLHEDVKRDYIKASTLTLNDAAYYLWNQKTRIDRIERGEIKPSGAVINLADPEVFREVVQKAIMQVHFDRENAHLGPTLARMQIAHPCESKKNIQAAIKSAVKFDIDCVRYFSYKCGSHMQDSSDAVERARLENPDFSEETYKLAFHSMCVDMR